MNPDRNVSGRAPTVPPFGDAHAAPLGAPAPVIARLPPFATRMANMPASAVREILKVAEQPDILSFAGGLPAPELFPVTAIAEAHAEVLANHGGAALQYSTTEGFAPLRGWIAEHLQKRGIPAKPDELLITSGSQQGIDLVARVFLDPGDVVLVESPTYLAALQAFAAYQVRFVAVPSDEHGMQTDQLAELIETHRPKLIYLVPSFQNPSGTTLPPARRLELVRIASEHQVAILEDDPYGELSFHGAPPKPIAAASHGNVIYLGTFSKTLAPGMRIGWVWGDTSIIRKATIAKQAADLHTATLAQRAAMALLQRFDYAGHVAHICDVYGERCQIMLNALTEHTDGCRWVTPTGGMFVWLQLPDGLNAVQLLETAIARKVAFVPGSAFFADNVRHDFVRLNFSNQPPASIVEGMKRFGQVIAAARK
ncbi:MAG TPA: PLP-dependent aminotransferase family protein [Kofleriaceae bacterium]|nr:PLP-dependent aminotransferase family protein [Kofleriaceae bacterium]